MKHLFCLMIGLFFTFQATANNQIPKVESSLKKTDFFQANSTKKNLYRSKGVIIGGDSSMQNLSLTKIRRALSNQGYERIVLDFASSSGARDAQKSGYYQVGIQKDAIILSLRGIQGVTLTAEQLQKAFANSRLVESVNIYPALKAMETLVEFKLRKRAPVEVFDLKTPGRIVVDLRAR